MPAQSKIRNPLKDTSGLPTVRRCKISQLKDESAAHIAQAWKDEGHTLTVISHNDTHPMDQRLDQLYVDHVHIHPDNWNWLDKPHELVWKQGTGENLTEGSVSLFEDGRGGVGMTQFQQDSQLYSAQLVTIKPKYLLDTSADAGASINFDMVLKWDTSSDKWKQATWSRGALEYSYWIVDPTGEENYQISSEFKDVDADTSWAPNSQFDDDPFIATSSVNVDEKNILTFTSSNGIPPENTIIPSMMTFQLSALADEVTGGAMVVGLFSGQQTVYALRGRIANSYAVGSYSLLDKGTNQMHSSKLITHGGKLIVDGAAVPTSQMIHNMLRWTGLTPAQRNISGLPESGHVEFTPNGEYIIDSSLNAKGFRNYSQREIGLNDAYYPINDPEPVEPPPEEPEEPIEPPPEEPFPEEPFPEEPPPEESFPEEPFPEEPFPEEPPPEERFPEEPVIERAMVKQSKVASSSQESNLSVTQLINMDPTGYTNDNELVDEVQQRTMEDFYKILQYYMPEKYFSTFIGSERPDLGDVEGIAKDNPAVNESFYESLAVPYLTSALKNSGISNPAVKRLNARRAQNFLSRGVSNDPIYKSQSGKLYSHHWAKKFPLMQDFLDDQMRNTPEQHADIDKEAQIWRANVTEGIPDVSDDLNALIDDAVANGKNSLYWGFKLFRNLCGIGALQQMQNAILFGHSAAIVAKIQRYSSVLTILDPSGKYSTLYHQTMQALNLANLLPQRHDIGSDNTFENYVDEIMKKFVEQYADSTDPNIQEQLSEINEAIAKGQLLVAAKMLVATAAEFSGTFAWTMIVNTFKSRWVKGFGKLLLKMVDSVCALAAVYSIVLLAKGQISWGDMTTLQQIALVDSCLSLFVIVVKKGVSAVVIFGSCTLLDSLRVLFGKNIQNTVKLSTGFRKWVFGNTGAAQQTGKDGEAMYSELIAEEEGAVGEETKLSKFFGKNLDEFMGTRFTAVMSVVGIGLSIWGIIESDTPMEVGANVCFLLSSGIDAVLSVGTIVLGALEVTEIGGFAVSAISSVLGPLAIIGAIVGVVLMLVEKFAGPTPPDPVEDFVNSDEVRIGGFYMENETAIDYFYIDSDDVSGWISFKAENQYLTMQANGALNMDFSLTYGFETLFTVYTDYTGYSKIMTNIFTVNEDKSTSSRVVALTLDDDKNFSMQTQIKDEKKQSQQFWTIVCNGNVKKDDKDHLESALFSLENVYHKGYFLRFDGDHLHVSKSASYWTFKKQFSMAPKYLTVPDLTTTSTSSETYTSPHLGQGQNSADLNYAVSPNLPNFLTMDSDGVITSSSKQPPDNWGTKTYTMTVSNAHGSASGDFNVIVTPQPVTEPQLV